MLAHQRNRTVDGKVHKIKNLVAFCHGLPGYLSLNYSGPGDNMNIYARDFEQLPTDVFATGGKFFSYACRTAVSSTL